MTQQDYEILVNCIKLGAPAYSDYLINSLNSVITKSIKYDNSIDANKIDDNVTENKEEK